MAYRKIHDSFWTDPDIEELTPEQRYFYLYLLTNPACNQIGLFEFSIRRAVFETGYNRETIEKLLAHFEMLGKIKVSTITKEIVICNFYHHNKSNSPKVITHVQQLLKNIKDETLVQYIYGIGTLPQEKEKQEETEKEEKVIIRKQTSTEINHDQVLAIWNQLFDCNLRLTESKNRQIRARLKTFKIDEIVLAMKHRSQDTWLKGEGSKFFSDWQSFWRSDEKIERYLYRKETTYIKNQTNPFK